MNSPTLKEEIAEMFDKELIDFLALRYDKSAEEIINQFLIQNGGDTSVCPPPCQQKTGFTLEGNEMEILRAYYNQSIVYDSKDFPQHFNHYFHDRYRNGSMQ